MEKIGKYLRLIREEKGLSLRKLGEMIDVSHNRLGKFERGEEKPSIEMIEKIESVLGILIDNCFVQHRVRKQAARAFAGCLFPFLEEVENE